MCGIFGVSTPRGVNEKLFLEAYKHLLIEDLIINLIGFTKS